MASALVALGAGWTPEEAARYQVELLRGLAADPKAQRLYLRKVQIVEAVRAKTTDGLQEDTLHEAKTKNLDKAAAVADGRSSSSSGQPTGAATKSRGRRRKSEAQRRKSVEKLQHKKLQSRCEAAATKVGGSPPRVLARVLACCGRFWQLLDHEGGEMMKRLKEAEAAKSKAAAEDSAGLNAMHGRRWRRRCCHQRPIPWTKTMHSLTIHRCPELGSSAVGCLRAASSSLRGWNHLCSASQRRQGRRRAEAGRLISWTPRRPTLRRYSSGLRTEAVRSEAEPMACGEPKFPCDPTNTS